MGRKNPGANSCAQRKGATPAADDSAVAGGAPAEDDSAKLVPVHDRTIGPGSVVRIHGAQYRSEASLALVLHPYTPNSSKLKPGWIVRPMGTTKQVFVAPENCHTARATPGWLYWLLLCASIAAVLAAIGSHVSGPGTLMAGLAPLGSLIALFSTVSLCYWFHSPLMDEGVVFPAISELAVSDPSRSVYRVGFAICGLLLGVTVVQLEALIALAQDDQTDMLEKLARWPPSLTWLEMGFYEGMMAAFGITLQGVFTLRLDFGAETMTHLVGAMIAMFGAMQHGTMGNGWFGRLPSTSPLVEGEWRAFALWLRRESFHDALDSPNLWMAAFLVPLTIQALNRFRAPNGGQMFSNLMGLMQWVIVVGIAAYFSTYMIDLTAPLSPPQNRPKQLLPSHTEL